jgi:hypothetical protein
LKVELPSNTSGLRLSLAVVIVLMVILSPTVMLVNTSLIAAPSSTDGSTPAPSTISQGGDFGTEAALQIPRTLQSTDLVNSLAFYEVTFITSTTGAIDKIRMDFPAGTNVAAAGVIERIGIGGGTLLKSGSSITYDVTTPVSIPAGTFIRLEMFGIKNPGFPSTAFAATITTRDSGGNLIDGPSQTNFYTVKQVGTDEIANFAVTNLKLASGSITPPTIAESFMKKVTLLDTPSGNAAGWTPDGTDTQFTISESAIIGEENSLVNIVVTNAGNVVCIVSHIPPAPASSFNVACITAPIDGAHLNYVVENLPEHVS